MKTCDDIDMIRAQTVVNGIRESTQESPTESDGDLWKRLGEFGDKVDDVFKRENEFITKPETLRVVPFPGQYNV